MYSINNYHIPRISSFTEAKARWEAVTPIRGKALRPLGDRRKQHMQIIKHDEDTYSCRLYYTDLVTYKSNGDVIVDFGGWNTISSRAFIGRVLPQRYLIFNYKAKLHIRDLQNSKVYYIPSNGPVTIRENGHIIGTLQPIKQVVDREATAAIRRVYKPFLAWAKQFIALMGSDIFATVSGREKEVSHPYAQSVIHHHDIRESDYVQLLLGFSILSNRLAPWYLCREDVSIVVEYKPIHDYIIKNTKVMKTINLPEGAYTEA